MLFVVFSKDSFQQEYDEPDKGQDEVHHQGDDYLVADGREDLRERPVVLYDREQVEQDSEDEASQEDAEFAADGIPCDDYILHGQNFI